MSEEIGGAEPHFKTGFMGWCARFFMKQRAARDPFDQTVILPCIICLVLAKLNDLGRVDGWAVIVGLIVPASVAGLWIGISFGQSGQFRAMLRSVLVGALEGAGSVAMAKETVTQHDALINAFNLMYVNYVFFWIFSLFSSLLSDSIIISEQDWQKAIIRRVKIRQAFRSTWHEEGYIRKVFRLTFAPENIARALATTLISLMLSAVFIAISKYYYGISLDTIFRSRFGVK